MLVPVMASESLSAERLFNIGPLPFTNAMLYGVLVGIVLLGTFWAAAKASQLYPKSKLAFYVETLIDLLIGMMTETFGSREKAMKHFPLLISLFIFILACNISGLLPGVQTITYNGTGLFRAWTTDLNSTLAMAVISLGTVHFYAIKQMGGWGYFTHFFSGNRKNPMTYFIGLNELFGEILRLVTLSLRLFGVIYGGEALLTAISALAGNFGWAASLPIIFLELFVCVVQAYLFMMLTASYIVMSTGHGESEHKTAAQPATAGSH